jgi:hypothetical protein
MILGYLVLSQRKRAGTPIFGGLRPRSTLSSGWDYWLRGGAGRIEVGKELMNRSNRGVNGDESQ